MSTSSSVAETVWKEIESTRSVTGDQVSILHFLFGKNFERATRIVDQRGVKRIFGEPIGRWIFQSTIVLVIHSSMTLLTGEQIYHQLAARLAASLGACVEVKISDEQLAQLLSKL